MKKQPDKQDKYKTLKCSFNMIFKNKDLTPKIFDAVNRTHQIIIHTYQFIRLWLLHKYHNNKNLPIIDKNVIKMAFKALVKESSGPKPKGNNLKLYNKFIKFYNNTYKKLGYKDKIDANNLSQILGYISTDMVTSIENNIKNNYQKYLNRYIRSSFKKNMMN